MVGQASDGQADRDGAIGIPSLVRTVSHAAHRECEHRVTLP
jgi:hypothetical protein